MHNSNVTDQPTSPFLFSSLKRPASVRTPNKAWPPDDEIIPDSEEERIILSYKGSGLPDIGTTGRTPEPSPPPMKGPHIAEPDVIVISSDSDEESASQRLGGVAQSSGPDDPLIKGNTGGPGGNITRQPLPDKGKAKAQTPITQSHSEVDSDVIYISDTDSGMDIPAPSVSPTKLKILQRTLTPYAPIINPVESGPGSNDPAILTFDPHVKTKPVAVTPSAKSRTPARSREQPVSTTGTPTAAKSPRKGKVSPEQLRLEAYARTLFDELNVVVFKGKMPQTELVWNVRLLSTAGKAFYTRNRYKQMTLKIELSSKVVDCDERVRHTLAHEMCHLAVWVLDNDPHERGHGPQFKTWAARVTKARPEIVISTKHTYEINYKFNWECVECGKVYGRHSNSINVEKSACGVCNPPGRLKPLFEKRTRRTANSMTSGSKLAAGSPRESPRAHNHPPRSPEKSPMKPKTVAATSQRWYPGPEVDLSDQDDVNELIKGFATVSLKGGK